MKTYVHNTLAYAYYFLKKGRNCIKIRRQQIHFFFFFSVLFLLTVTLFLFTLSDLVRSTGLPALSVSGELDLVTLRGSLALAPMRFPSLGERGVCITLRKRVDLACSTF